jgi:hypothetical protein
VLKVAITVDVSSIWDSRIPVLSTIDCEDELDEGSKAASDKHASAKK